MLDVGFFEMLIVGIIGLLILGPERLPVMMRTLGLFIGKAKAAFNQFKDDMEVEARNLDMKERLEKNRQALADMEKQLNNDVKL